MFGDTLIALDKGATVAELNARLSEVVAAVRATAKGGAITLTLKIVPGGKGATDMVFITPSITARLPQEEKNATLFFTTDDNRLTRNNERQPELPFEGRNVIEMRPDMVRPDVFIKEAM